MQLLPEPAGEFVGGFGVVLVPHELLHVVAERLADFGLGNADNRDALDRVSRVDVGLRLLLLLSEGGAGREQQQGDDGESRDALNHARCWSKLQANS